MAAGSAVASMFVELGADVSGLNKGFDTATKQMSTFEKGMGQMQKIGVAAFAAIGVASAAALGALAAGVVSATKAAADFEQNLADVGATMNLTGKEADVLQDFIGKLALDPKLKVNATEATAAIGQLGQAGLSLDQIMAGAGRSTIALSNATGGDMASSAKLITDLMGQYNIKAEDTARIVDVVTGLTVSSKFAFNDVALAFGQVGGVAGSLNLSLEDTAAMLGVTAKNFNSGSDAATSMKTFLQRLVPTTVEATDEMRRLGLFTGSSGEEFEAAQLKLAKVNTRLADLDPTSKNYEKQLAKLTAEQQALTSQLVKGTNAFFDSNEMQMGAENIAKQLNSAFGELSDARRSEAASTIYGTDAMRTAFGLMEGGIPAIVNMKKKIGDVSAEEIAAKRMDTFAGSMEIAAGVVEMLSINIGQKFLPILRPLIDRFTELASTHGPKVVDFFGKLADKLAGVITKSLDFATRALPPLWDRLVAVGDVVKKVTDVIGNFIAKLGETFMPVTTAIAKFMGWQDVTTALGILLGGALIAAIGAFVAAMWPIISLVAQVTAAVGILRFAWENDFAQLRTVTQNTLEKISRWFFTESGIWKGSLEATLTYLKWWGEYGWREYMYNPVVRWVSDTTRELIMKWNNAVITTKAAFSTWWTDSMYILETFKNDIVNSVIWWTDEVIKTVEYWTGRTKSLVTLFVNEIREKFEEWRDNAVRIYNQMVTDVQEWVRDTFSWFKPREWLQAGIDLVQGLWDGLKQKWDDVKSWWRGEAPELSNEFARINEERSPSKVFERHGMNLMEGLRIGIAEGIPAVTASLTSLTPAVNSVMTGVIGSITTNGTTLMGHIAGFIDESALWIKTSIEGGAQMWRNAIDGSLRPVLNDYNAMMNDAKNAERAAREAWEAARLATINMPPINPPLVEPPTVAPNPWDPGTPPAQPPATTTTATGIGTQDLGAGLWSLLSQGNVLADIQRTAEKVNVFASNVRAFLTSEGQPDLQAGEARVALELLQSEGVNNASVDRVLNAIQILIRTMQERGFGNNINISQAPDASEIQRIELQQLVAYLNAMYS